MSDIDKILDEIDEVIDKASPFPLTAHKLIIDGDRLKDLIYDMRENLPQEIQKANIIVHDCERLKREAEVKAEDIIRQAEDRARNLVSENEITKQAKQKAYEMLMQAQNKSKDVKNAANIYVENLLSDTEAYFHQNLQEVKRTRQQILNVKK